MATITRDSEVKESGDTPGPEGDLAVKRRPAKKKLTENTEAL
jgi:hypothetical protein